nr:hypothetical protein [Thalassospira sp. B30-1]
MRPLILRDIAEAIGMHESTVSRVTNGKFMATPRGVYELKYFFTTAISSADGGDAHSSESVRHRIKSLIDGEDPKKILSDDKLVELLQKGRDRHRPPNSGKIPRSDENSLVGPATARKKVAGFLASQTLQNIP